MTNPEIAILSRKDVQEKLKWEPRVGDLIYDIIGKYTYRLERNQNPMLERSVWLPDPIPTIGQDKKRTLVGMFKKGQFLNLHPHYPSNTWQCVYHINTQVFRVDADTPYLALLKALCAQWEVKI